MNKYWFNISDKIRFVIVGIVNAGISYLIYSFFCFVFGIQEYQRALALAWVISSVLSFCLQRKLVFQSSGTWGAEYLKCCTTWLFSYLINATLLEIIVRFLSLNVYLSQIIATAIAGIFTYILFKYFAFKK